MLLPVLAHAAQVTTGIDEEATLPYWQVAGDGMSLRLVQRLPDQTRAFFMARGFSAEDTEIVAQSCVFQTVFKNTSDASSRAAPLAYDLRDWQVRHAGRTGAMKTREDWNVEWERRKVASPARIAFEWALFPTEQVYNPGDYNWGMSVFGLKPGTVFDLRVSWNQFGARHEALIEDIECAADLQPQE